MAELLPSSCPSTGVLFADYQETAQKGSLPIFGNPSSIIPPELLPMSFCLSPDNFNQNNPPPTPLALPAQWVLDLPSPDSPEQFEFSALSILDQIQELLPSHQKANATICNLQKQYFIDPHKEAFETLKQLHNILKGQLDAGFLQLNNLEKSHILSPVDIHRTFYLLQDLQLQVMQLELYHQELDQLNNEPGSPLRWFSLLLVLIF